jgi:hypothetical protein
MSDERLLSAGTAADSATIQLLETIAVVGAAAAAGLGLTSAGIVPPLVLFAAALLAIAAAFALRRERVLRNENAARSERRTIYYFPKERMETIDNMSAPPDVKNATLLLVGHGKPRLEILRDLTARLGETRATEFLPAILQQADKHVR